MDDPSTSADADADVDAGAGGTGPEADASSAEAESDAGGVEPDAGTGDYEDPVGDLLPYASVDSNWWYWIAAPLVFFVLSLVGGVLFFVGFLFDVFLTGGLLTFGLAVVAGSVAALVGLVLSVMFPVAVYVDARALSDDPASSWSPDPLLYGLVALAGVVLTAFTVSVPLAIYYLYRRHVAVGTP
jgi:hypothetical protein